MLIIWYADFEGSDKELAKVNKIFDEITRKIGGKVEGPYYPQKES